MNIDDYRYCPECKADLQGPEIPEEYQGLFREGTTHYSRWIGFEDGSYDGVSYWQCPDCRTSWNRWTGKKLDKPLRLDLHE